MSAPRRLATLSAPVARGYTRFGLDKVSNPSILPIPGVRGGNNVPHSMHKTRRMWKPNTTRYTLPVNIVGGAHERRDLAHKALAEDPEAIANPKYMWPQFNKVKLTQRQLKTVLKAGGLEGMLLSHPSKHFTPQGRALRYELFETLRRERDLNATTQAANANALSAKPKMLLIGDGKKPRKA